jgi:hypothetical protein
MQISDHDHNSGKIGIDKQADAAAEATAESTETAATDAQNTASAKSISNTKQPHT